MRLLEKWYQIKHLGFRALCNSSGFIVGHLAFLDPFIWGFQGAITKTMFTAIFLYKIDFLMKCPLVGIQTVLYYMRGSWKSNIKYKIKHLGIRALCNLSGLIICHLAFLDPFTWDNFSLDFLIILSENFEVKLFYNKKRKEGWFFFYFFF